MQRRRQQEEMGSAEQLEQMPPEERQAFEHNLKLWKELPPEERQALRSQAGERMREETERAYQESGLTLDADQREVFALRYRQERRKLERDLQEKATAERARRMPEIMERLRHEFNKASTMNAPKPTPSPTPTPGPSPAATSSASPRPTPASPPAASPKPSP